MQQPSIINQFPKQEEAELVARDLFRSDSCLHTIHYKRGDIIYSNRSGQLGRVVTVDHEQITESQDERCHISTGGWVHYYLLWQRPIVHQKSDANDLILIESWTRQKDFVSSTIERMDKSLEKNEKKNQKRLAGCDEEEEMNEGTTSVAKATGKKKVG